MTTLRSAVTVAFAALTAIAGVSTSHDLFAQSTSGGIDISQQPLFTQSAQAPMNMLVMGKDHKIYYEAYNDASDLNGDGALDIGYKPATIDYYGYFNSKVCYTWSTDRFVPAAATANKQCSGQWSGDFLNYLTTSRMDALRRVLYGGWRQVDSTTETVLQGSYFPQDGHSWGKEYQSVARDGYNISNYAPLSVPGAGRYHLFAITTLTGNTNAYPNYQAPMFRVLKNTDKRVWNWLSIEGPVAGTDCFTASNSVVPCVTAAGAGTWELVPSSSYSGLNINTWKRTIGSGSPANRTEMNSLFTDNAKTSNLCGTAAISLINVLGANNNPFVPGARTCTHENYLTKISGKINIAVAGSYKFAVDGDDAVDLLIDNSLVASWYGGHGNVRTDASLESHSGTVTLTAGLHDIEFRHQEATGDDNWGLFLYKAGVAVSRDDYYVRVQSCPSAAASATLRESTCKQYPNGQYKPTGILHDYGESSRMFFGLITGSQFNNLEGGVLRRNISNFSDEITTGTGQFITTVNGIANTISRLRMIGGGYNTNTDSGRTEPNWNWAGGTGSCPSVGNRAIDNGECRMWGNPLAEMLYESMRYFAGAAAPTARFNAGASSAGNAEETTMGLRKETWKDPYGAIPNGGGFLACAKPYQTVISDINPSYDGDLPGSPFTGAITTTGTTPTSISGFNASAQGQLVWNSEFGAGARSVFIGDVNNVTDGAPTAKTASSFGNIRGLSPEEPTKGGTYYSASVARFARVTDLSTAEGPQNLSTYAIALASPLPRIEFPIGRGKITLLPFAKTASGTFGDGTRKPTNTIVDFYVEKIVNLPGQPLDTTVNGGLAYAVFRINYEDVEQGNDHDMDAIVRYLISANVDGTVKVELKSEYAAGSADQNMGYIMSGTTQDGVYLDVRDTDSPASSFVRYALNTPGGDTANPLLPGACAVTTPPTLCNSQLPLTAIRTFTPTATAATGGATFLNDPLWYAAKYGGPNPAAWDADNDGTPDNYFLVTNPATLRTQLDKAFTDIIQSSLPSASVATSSPRYVNGSTLAYEVSYNSVDWTGDVRAYKLSNDGTYSGTTPIWSASARMPAAGSRKIFSAKRTGTAEDGNTFVGTVFKDENLSTGQRARIATSLIASVGTSVDANLINYLRGDKSMEQGPVTCTPSTCPYRKRSSKIGDILNSSPAVSGVASYGYSLLPTATAGTSAPVSYEAFVTAKKAIYGSKNDQPIIFVGANDGMLHAFDGREGVLGGTELFAYMPYSALSTVSELARPSYTHRYYVDGTPTIGDAYLSGSWKTVLAASVGSATDPTSPNPTDQKGGKGVYALDITDPRNFSETKVMWEFNSSIDRDMGQFVGRPSMGLTQDKKWVAVFGNGYNGYTQSAILYVRDLATGASIAKIDTGVGCSSVVPTCKPNGMATAVLVDNTGDGVGETIYAGDYLGNMWRFDQSSTGVWTTGNGNKPIFVAREGADLSAKTQSITSGIYSVAHPLGGTMVVFGTGRYLNADDANEATVGLGTRATVDSIYGVWDATRIWDEVNGVWTTTATNTAGGPVNLTALMALSGRADLKEQNFLTFTPLASDGTGGYRTATRNAVEFRTPDSPGTTASRRYMGWFIDLKLLSGTGSSARNVFAGERVTSSPQGILNDVIVNTFRPSGDSCQPGAQNATLVLDALTGAASFTPIVPAGGWPAGQAPPSGALIGTDTGIVPPAGEPPVIVIRPITPPVPCLPGSADCDETPPLNDVKTCSWRSPNAANRTPGKLIPCGRISWKQLR